MVARAAAGGIATQIHAIGDAAVRAALDVADGDAARPPAHAPDRARPDGPSGRPRPVRRGRDRGQRPARPLGSDAAKARRLWGERAEARGYTWASLARTGAVVAFGTDAPVEPFDPWPGHRPGRPSRGSALAGRDAARSRRPRRSRSTARSGRPASIRPSRLARPTVAGSSRPAGGHRGHPGGRARRPGRAGRRARDGAAVDGAARRRGRLRALSRPVAATTLPAGPARGARRRTAR